MLSMKQILCEMEASLSKLNLCLDEQRFSDMPYLLGKLSSYNQLLNEMLNLKLCESSESVES